MNNEEKNIPQEENTPEINNSATPAQAGNAKLTPGVIGMIVGGFVMLILAIILMFVLVPGGDAPAGDSGADVNTDYTVTVLDNNGNPIQGVKLSFITPAGIPFPGTTDAQGKATYASEEDGVTVKVVSVPKGYEYDKLDAVQSFGSNRTLSVTLTAPDPIVINVVDNEGNPVAGVLVQMCDTTGLCKIPTVTDEEGKAYYAYEEGNFRAQLSGGAPDGYTVEDETAYYDIVNGTVTITLTKIAD